MMTRIELKEKVIKLRHLLEERKRLVEYAEQQFFYRKNKKSDLKTDYAKKGFVFGWSETIADKKKYSKKAYYDLVLDDLPKGLEQSEIKKKKQLMKDTISKEKELKSENS
jgi:hypothetical protein